MGSNPVIKVHSHLDELVVGWRGFLVGKRRNWHSHYRVFLSGHREGFLVIDSVVLVSQLKKVAGLLVEVYSRGGLTWGFGLLGGSASFKGGRWFTRWVPGTLSNFFFARMKRVPLIRKLSRLILGPRRRRRRRRRRFQRRLTFRWRRLRFSSH